MTSVDFNDGTSTAVSDDFAIEKNETFMHLKDAVSQKDLKLTARYLREFQEDQFSEHSSSEDHTVEIKSILKDGCLLLDEWKREIKIGDVCDVKEPVYGWYNAKIIARDGNFVTVHYQGWNSKYDQILELNEIEICPLYTFTEGGKGGVIDKTKTTRKPPSETEKLLPTAGAIGSKSFDIPVEGKRQRVARTYETYVRGLGKVTMVRPEGMDDATYRLANKLQQEDLNPQANESDKTINQKGKLSNAKVVDRKSKTVSSTKSSIEENRIGAGRNKIASTGKVVKPNTKNDPPLDPRDAEHSEKVGIKSLSQHLEVIRPFVNLKAMTRLEAVRQSLTRGEIEMLKRNSLNIDSIPQPQTLVRPYELKWYQLEGLSWLVKQYCRRVNCILADEMGLGKTIQSIAFIAHILHVRKEPGPHLVVVPLTVMANWITEFKKFCPSIKVLRFHSNDADEQVRLKHVARDMSKTEVVVTTYGTISKPGNTFSGIVWRTLILDEGHKIKNNETNVAVSSSKIKSLFKVILTGTPVQNNLHETWSLLKFLCPSLFTDSSAFDSAFNLNNNTNVKKEKERESEITDKNVDKVKIAGTEGGVEGEVEVSAMATKESSIDKGDILY